MNKPTAYLYRGVSFEYFEKTNGKLIPKSDNSFTHIFKYGERGLTYGSGATYGSSSKNAVLKHQYNQEGYPTSGVSTTLHIARAQFYATDGGKYKTGYIYKIDRNLLEANGVTEFIVADYVKMPSIPEDDEVILVEKNYGILPDEIIVEIITFIDDENNA